MLGHRTRHRSYPLSNIKHSIPRSYCVVKQFEHCRITKCYRKAFKCGQPCDVTADAFTPAVPSDTKRPVKKPELNVKVISQPFSEIKYTPQYLILRNFYNLDFKRRSSHSDIKCKCQVGR